MLDGLLDKLQGDLELGAKVGIVLAFGKVALWSVRLDLQWVIHPLIGPQAGSGNDSVVDLAQIPQILTRHMSWDVDHPCDLPSHQSPGLPELWEPSLGPRAAI